jgi:acyl carrier protein
MTAGWDARFEVLVRAAARRLPAEAELTPDTDLLDWGLDSLAIVGLLAGIEAAYGSGLPDEALNYDTLGTPGALWKAVSALSGPGLPEA